MWLLLVAASMLASPYLLAAYLRGAKRRMQHAQAAWEHMERHARVLLEDRHLNPEVGDAVETIVRWAGKRLLTFASLWALAPRRRGRKKGATLWQRANGPQSDQLIRFILGAVLYDSYRTPFFGALLRHRLYWLATTATDKSVPVSEPAAEPIVSAAAQVAKNHRQAVCA